MNRLQSLSNAIKRNLGDSSQVVEDLTFMYFVSKV